MKQLVAKITPALQGLKPAELTEEDIRFLSSAKQVNPEHIAFLVASARLGKKTGRRQRFSMVFSVRTCLQVSHRFSPSVQMRNVAGWSPPSEQYCSRKTSPDVRQIPNRLEQLILLNAFESTGVENKASVGDLLTTTLEDKNTQTEFLTLLLKHKGPIEEVLEEPARRSALPRAGRKSPIHFPTGDGYAGSSPACTRDSGHAAGQVESTLCETSPSSM